MANYGSTIWPAALLDMSKEYGRFLLFYRGGLHLEQGP
jgi:hypothetical protein